MKHFTTLPENCNKTLPFKNALKDVLKCIKINAFTRFKEDI